MFRMFAALLLMNGATAWAQGSHVGEDQKRLQGIWRVCDVVGPAEAKVFMARLELAFEGNKMLPLSDGDLSVEFSYSLDPTKDPKHINLKATLPRVDVPGQKPPAPQQVTISGIYAFEQNRLKLRIAQQPGERHPIDFSIKAPKGPSDCVLILERDASPNARSNVKDARVILAIRDLGGQAQAFSDANHAASPTTLTVKLDKTKGDALLMKIIPQMKALSRVTELQLDGSEVTDAGLASLNGLDNVQFMNLEGTSITDSGLNHLRNMTRLKLLDVSDTKVTNEGVAKLKKSLPQLQVTHFSRAEKQSQLAITNAGGTQSSDEDGRLLEIRFTRGKLSDFQLLGLQKRLEVWKTTLRSIDLADCHISDRGLQALAGLTNLRQLNLEGTDVTVAGVKSLKRTVPNLKVKH